MNNSSNKKKKSGYSAKKLALCAMMAALGIVLLYLGSFLNVLDISAAVLASLLCIAAVIEYGGSAPWMIYGVTAILSLLLLPNKSPAVFYTLFFGFYPIIKEKLEKLPRILSWVLKLIVFNVCLALLAVSSIYLLGLADSTLFTPLLIAVTLVLCEAVFLLYDIALTRLLTFYIVKLRSRFKFK